MTWDLRIQRVIRLQLAFGLQQVEFHLTPRPPFCPSTLNVCFVTLSVAGHSQKPQKTKEVKAARENKGSAVPPFLFCPYPSFDLDRYNDFEKMKQLERERIEREAKVKKAEEVRVKGKQTFLKGQAFASEVPFAKYCIRKPWRRTFHI